jgi:hypothetical protein
MLMLGLQKLDDQETIMLDEKQYALTILTEALNLSCTSLKDLSDRK